VIHVGGLVGGLLCGWLLAACGDDEGPVHCADVAGDATCAELHPDGSRPYCVRGWCDVSARDGCVAVLPDDPDCPAPCGAGETGGGCGETSSAATTSPTDATATSPPDTSATTSVDSSESAAADSSSTGPTGCVEDRECDAATPFCAMGACVPCSQLREPDAGCAGLDPDRPLCIDDACVQCSDRDTTVCTGTVPICDVETHTCIGCTQHEQCPASACQFADGSCLPEDRVFHVDGDAADCAGADGSEAAPFCTIAAALAGVGPAGRATLRIAATALPYLEPVAIGGDRIVALVPWSDASPVLDSAGVGSTLTVDGATVYVWRVRFEGSGQAPAITLTDARGWIDRTVVVLNDGGGIRVDQGAELHLRNGVIGANGTGLAARVGLDADAGARPQPREWRRRPCATE